MAMIHLLKAPDGVFIVYIVAVVYEAKRGHDPGLYSSVVSVTYTSFKHHKRASFMASKQTFLQSLVSFSSRDRTEHVHSLNVCCIYLTYKAANLNIDILMKLHRAR